MTERDDGNTRQPTIDDVKRYLSDLDTIRGLMTRYDERPLVGHWVYAVWGLLVIVGSIINWTRYETLRAANLDALIVIWIPILIIGSIIETLGVVLKSRDTGIPIVTRRMGRLAAASVGILLILGIVVAHLDTIGFTAAILIALAATPLLIYAQATYSELFVEAFALLAAAIIVGIIGANSLALRGVSGVAVGIVYVVAGLHSWSCERRGPGRSQSPDRSTGQGPGPSQSQSPSQSPGRSAGQGPATEA